MKTYRHRSSAIREALPFIALSDIPAEHKSVVMEVIAQALKDAEESERSGLNRSKVGPWTAEELQAVAARLDGKIAANWQHADELVIDLAARLNRNAADVKEKAKELGFAAGVDYRIARERWARENP